MSCYHLLKGGMLDDTGWEVWSRGQEFCLGHSSAAC